MLKTLRSKTQAGFTLVEIMIVVAIIALLASIAVPNFLRARLRSQATRVAEDARILDAAKDQWAIEHNKAGADPLVWDEIVTFLKPGSPLTQGRAAGNAPVDLFNNVFSAASIEAPVKLHANTINKFDSLFGGTTGAATSSTEAQKFFGSAHPSTGAAPAASPSGTGNP